MYYFTRCLPPKTKRLYFADCSWAIVLFNSYHHFLLSFAFHISKLEHKKNLCYYSIRFSYLFLPMLVYVLNVGQYCRSRPVGRVEARSPLEREVWGSNLGPVKSNTVLATARLRCNISSKGAVLAGRNNAEMALQTRYTLGRSTSSTMKDLILTFVFL